MPDCGRRLQPGVASASRRHTTSAGQALAGGGSFRALARRTAGTCRNVRFRFSSPSAPSRSTSSPDCGSALSLGGNDGSRPERVTSAGAACAIRTPRAETRCHSGSARHDAHGQASRLDAAVVGTTLAVFIGASPLTTKRQRATSASWSRGPEIEVQAVLCRLASAASPNGRGPAAVRLRPDLELDHATSQDHYPVECLGPPATERNRNLASRYDSVPTPAAYREVCQWPSWIATEP